MDKIRQKLKMYAHHPASFLLALLVWISAIFTAVTLIFIVGYFDKGCAAFDTTVI